MTNINHEVRKFKGGSLKMCVNDKVEVISNSNEELYGMVGLIKDIKESNSGTELRLETSDGFETWIDAEDVELYSL